MPSEPNKSVEDTLRTYAAKRRKDAGAPMELHPVTRRMFQEEVARLRLRKAKQSGFHFFSGPLFWPRVSLAGSALLLAGVLTWIWVASLKTDYEVDQLVQLSPSADNAEKPLPPEPVSDDARTKKVLPEANAQRGTPVLPAAATELDALKTAQSEQRGRNATIPAATERPESKVLSLAAQPRPRLSLAPTRKSADAAVLSAKDIPASQQDSEMVQKAIQTQGTTKNLAFSQEPAAKAYSAERLVPEDPTTMAAAKAAPTAESRRVRESQAQRAATQFQYSASKPIRLQYQRVPVSDQVNDRSREQAPPNFLAEFELEARNGRIRLVDQDGSIYEGAILSTAQRFFGVGHAAADKQNGTEETAWRRSAGKHGSAPTNFGWAALAKDDQDATVFRVSGTNRDANQYVIIQGALSSEPAIDGFRGNTPASRQETKPPASFPIITSAPTLSKPVAQPTKPATATSSGVAEEPPTSPEPTQVWARFRGAATINGTNQVKIEAVRMP